MTLSLVLSQEDNVLKNIILIKTFFYSDLI